MRAVPLRDLPSYSVWPARLLGQVPFPQKRKTRDAVYREYDTEKFGKYLAYLRRHPRTRIEKMKELERGVPLTQKICVSRGNNIYECSAREAARERDKSFLAALTPLMKQADTVIELGSGYGYNLALLKKKFPNHTYIGGEFSPRARTLAAALSNGKWKTLPFDFYDKNNLFFKKIASERVLILTCHSVEMLPDAELFLKYLSRFKHQIVGVVQLEPVYELYKNTDLLDLMRKRYIELNGYNKNLLSCLKAHSDIQIEKVTVDLFGLNPLFPESLLVWKFKKKTI